MKQIISFSTFLILLILISCKTDNISGIYVCDYSNKKGDTTINNGNNINVYIDLTCTIQELDFKGNNTVELKMKNGLLATSYVVDKDYIRIKSSGTDILFRINDDKTISGEGIFEGLYRKK